MPNWTFNEIRFDSEKNFKLFKEALISKDEKGEDIVDFNKLIPMPKSLDMTLGSITDVAIMCYLTNKLEISFDDLDVNKKALLVELVGYHLDADNISQEIIDRVNSFNETKDNLYELGKQYVENYKKYGSTTWYDWRRNNWGVKWNACSTQIFDDSVYFETPWNEPAEIIVKLIKDYPQINFILSCEYEDMLGQPPKVFIYKDKTLKVVQLQFPQKGSKLYNKYQDDEYCDEGKAFNPYNYYKDMLFKGFEDNFKNLVWSEVYKETGSNIRI